MFKIALISDVHSNLFALQAVLKDCEKQGVSKIFFLGDAIGYGPKPIECLDLLIDVCDLEYSLIGNHDFALIDDEHLEGWASAIKAKNALLYTRKLLKFDLYNKKGISNKYIDWIKKLKKAFNFQDTQLFVHGSPKDPIREYLTPQHFKETENFFDDFPHLCFSGHTHIPGVYAAQDMKWFYPKDISHQFVITEDKAYFNIGSVGQPRDNDPRACYGIFEGDLFTWRRIEYDVAATANQIFQISEIDDFMGHRLLAGR